MSSSSVGTYFISILYTVPDYIFEEKNGDLKKLVRLPVKAKWMTLAKELDIPKSKIDEIAATNHGHPESQALCLTTMFSYWLNNDDCPSYNKLKEAVEQLDNKNEVLDKMKEMWGDKLLQARRDALGETRVAADSGASNRPEGEVPDYYS